MNRKYSLLVTLLVLVLLLSSSMQNQNVPARAQQSEPEQAAYTRTITVTGMGQAGAQPDIAVVRLGVRTEAETAQEALAQNSEQMEALLAALRSAGIDRADIQTQVVQLHPRYGENLNRERSADLVGYTAVNIVSVRVLDLEQLGEILDEAVGAGSNTIEGLHFEIDDPGELYVQALEEAMEDAEGKAQRLAALAGAQLGEVISISEGASPSIPPGAGRALDFAEQSVPVEPGTQNATATLQVTWLLVDSGSLPPTGGTPGAPTPTPSAEVLDFDDLVSALRSAGARVNAAGEIRQPFVPVEGELLRVNGLDVQVFEFQDAAARQAVSDTISETGDAVGNTILSWVGQPNFWAEGRLIVLYVGENQNLIRLLGTVLGEPITSPDGEQGLPPVAAIAAQKNLAERLNVSTSQVAIVSSEQVEWTDSCLGLGGPNESCLQVITPGWRIVLRARGVEYVAHTDRLGDILRWR